MKKGSRNYTSSKAKQSNAAEYKSNWKRIQDNFGMTIIEWFVVAEKVS